MKSEIDQNDFVLLWVMYIRKIVSNGQTTTRLTQHEAMANEIHTHADTHRHSFFFYFPSINFEMNICLRICFPAMHNPFCERCLHHIFIGDVLYAIFAVCVFVCECVCMSE